MNDTPSCVFSFIISLATAGALATVAGPLPTIRTGSVVGGSRAHTTKMAPHTSHELENTIRCPRTPAITCIHTYVQICSHLVCEHAVRRTLWQLHACYGAQGNVPGWEHCPAYLPPTPAKVRAAQTRTKVAAPTLCTQSRRGHAGTRVCKPSAHGRRWRPTALCARCRASHPRFCHPI